MKFLVAFSIFSLFFVSIFSEEENLEEKYFNYWWNSEDKEMTCNKIMTVDYHLSVIDVFLRQAEEKINNKKSALKILEKLKFRVHRCREILDFWFPIDEYLPNELE